MDNSNLREEGDASRPSRRPLNGPRDLRQRLETVGQHVALGCYATATALALSVGRVSREVAAFLSIFSLAIESAATCVRSRGGLREAHLPTEQSSPRQEARLPSPDEHPRRASRAEGTSRQGPAQSVGLIWRIRERSAFTRLARGPADPGRSAVVHVHTRSRCNAAEGGVRARSRHRTSRCPQSPAQATAGAVGRRSACPPGLYLIGAQPARRTTIRSELAFDLERLVASAARLIAWSSAINGRSRVGPHHVVSPLMFVLRHRGTHRSRNRPVDLWLTVRRFVRCRPFGPSGYDPVPEGKR